MQHEKMKKKIKGLKGRENCVLKGYTLPTKDHRLRDLDINCDNLDFSLTCMLSNEIAHIHVRDPYLVLTDLLGQGLIK